MVTNKTLNEEHDNKTREELWTELIKQGVLFGVCFFSFDSHSCSLFLLLVFYLIIRETNLDLKNKNNQNLKK